jgi:hypothetical protein
MAMGTLQMHSTDDARDVELDGGETSVLVGRDFDFVH